MKHVENRELRALVAGTGEEEGSLRRLASEMGVADRVAFLGHVDEDELLGHYARCRGVFFAPLREDFGFVTLEAFRSRKPVLTCSDSGGPAELVVQGHSGFVVSPDPVEIAKHLDTWAGNREKAIEMGENGAEDSSDINWNSALLKLLLI
jgi:glycosyltransferase involved in cell wall biosynthesis